MKEYSIQDTNDFMFNTLSEFKNFQLYSGMQVYDILEKNLYEFPKYQTDNLKLSLKKYRIPITTPKGTKPYSKFHIYLKDKTCPQVWHNPKSPKEFSVKAKPGYTPDQGFSTYLNCESHIRNLKTNNFYLYVKFPYQFLRDHIGANVALADTQKYYSAIDTVDELSVRSIIDMHDKYDEIYPEKITYEGKSQSKPPYFFKWRRDMFPYMIYSLSKYGYYNPIMSSKTQVLFYGGTHRLTCGPAVKRDVPYLILLGERFKKQSDLSFITPKIMVGGKEMFFNIDLNRTCINGWYIEEERLRSSNKFHRNDELAPPDNTGKIHLLADKYINTEPDIRLNYTPQTLPIRKEILNLM